MSVFSRAKNLLPAIIWAIFIFLGSSVPGADVSANKTVNFVAHKSIHIIEYGIFYIFLIKGLGKKKISFSLGVLYAISDEFHQKFVFGRQGKISDILIDIVGLIVGYIFVWNLKQTPLKRLKNFLKLY